MKLVIWIIIAIGVVAIYDARKITIRYFNNQEQNLIVRVIKTMGFIVCVVAGTILCVM
ncbi:MAG: hypothetical protein IKG56_00855 [Clostridia bacterium]|nr:hypothetical protein [Clostridia bacterium]